MKKPRKPEVVEVRFRLLTAAPIPVLQMVADVYANAMAGCLDAKLVRKPTVERVGKK